MHKDKDGTREKPPTGWSTELKMKSERERERKEGGMCVWGGRGCSKKKKRCEKRVQRNFGR